jgi:hypothetical protein
MSQTIHIPEFNEVDKLKSTLSNFLLLDENWKNLKLFLESFLGDISSLLDDSIIQQIIDSIMERIQEFKIKLNFVYTVDVDYESIQGKYKVTKESDRSLSVTYPDKPDWDTSFLMVQVYDKSSGEILYPIIRKSVGSVEIEFTNEFYSDLTILMI